MRWQKIVAGTMALLLLSIASLYGYYVHTSLRDVENLLICATGEGPRIPSAFCKYYLTQRGLSSDELAFINTDLGVIWATEAQAREDREWMLRFLIKEGVSVNTRSRRQGYTALHLAVLFNDADAAQLLLLNGADMTLTDKISGKTPLQLARYLQARKAKPDRSDVIAVLRAHRQRQPD